MKTITKNLLTIAVCLLSLPVGAQDSYETDSLLSWNWRNLSDSTLQCEEIKGIVLENRDAFWYKDQAYLWHQETETNPKDAHAWMNYYRAVRYYFMSDVHDGSLFYTDIDATLTAIIEKMGQNIPDTYEYYACNYLLHQGDTASDKFAEQAIKTLPQKRTFFDYDTWIAYLDMSGQTDRFTAYAKDYYNSGIYSPEQIKFSMNELNGMEKGGIYVGNGDISIIPKWLIQEGIGKHQDKIIICYAFMHRPEYRQYVYDKLGIGKAPEHEGDFEYYEDYIAYIQQTINEIAVRTGRNIYFSKYMDDESYTYWQEGIYDEGLVYKYSPKKYNHEKVQFKNMTEVYDLDYLLQPQRPDAWATDNNMRISISSSLSNTYEYCIKKKQKQQAERLRQLLQANFINADWSNYDEEVINEWKEQLGLTGK